MEPMGQGGDRMPPVGRLAPSPTGAQHLGNARTYLLAWLSARSQQGTLVLRIEDLDSPRVKPWAIQQAMDDLRWLGLDWDEGPDVGGAQSPYIQTERDGLYRSPLQQLLAANRLYPCTCSRTDIEEAASAPHESIDGPIYSGRCAGWKVGDPLPPADQFCWRFRVPDQSLTIDDALCGPVTMNAARQLGDFPVTRKGGAVAYQLAVVVDDEQMGVTEVVRGNDLLPSAFRQRCLQQALGYRHLDYRHVPLVVGTDGRRLAKRHGDTRLSQYREQGVASEQIVGWAAYSAGLIQKPMPCTAASLVADFDWCRVNRNTVVVGADLRFE